MRDTLQRIALGADNKLRALWANSNGTASLWVIGGGGKFEVNNAYGPYGGWTAIAVGAGADNKMRALWANTDGRAALWQVAAGDQTGGGGGLEVNLMFGPY